MTQLQKDIITVLMDGGSIVGNSSYGYRLRDQNIHPVRTFSTRTFYHIKNLCRQNKGIFYINKNKVRQLHGRSWAKKHYKSLKSENGTESISTDC